MKKTAVILFLLMLLICHGLAGPAMAVPPATEDPVDDDLIDDDVPDREPGCRKPFRQYLPVDPRVKKMHLEAMTLAAENAKLMALRGALQPQLAALEMEEGHLRYLLLKNRLKYYRLRETLVNQKVRILRLYQC